MPILGLGTWLMKQEDEPAVLKAITEVGYRHIDTAAVYKDEDVVGRCVKSAQEKLGLKREDFFITTKLWRDNYSNPEAALRNSLEQLGMDYVDLYLIHWPLNWKDEAGNI